MRDKDCKHHYVRVLVMNSDKEYWQCTKCGKIKYYE